MCIVGWRCRVSCAGRRVPWSAGAMLDFAPGGRMARGGGFLQGRSIERPCIFRDEGEQTRGHPGYYGIIRCIPQFLRALTCRSADGRPAA